MPVVTFVKIDTFIRCYLFIFFFFCCVLADIYDKVSEELEKDDHLDCECIGGGRIKHDPQDKKIHVYGYSMVRPDTKVCTKHIL